MAKIVKKNYPEKISIRHADLDQMGDDEKCVFFQAGMILNDLRFFDLSLQNHMNAMRNGSKLQDAEGGILLSQVTLLLAHLAGTLNEAHQVVVKSYFLPTVSKKYAPLLSLQATEALSRIKTFFSSKNNLVSHLRNNFGFHYDRKHIIDMVKCFPAEWEHHVFLPHALNNAFVEFGQTCSMNALFKSTGASDGSEGLFHVFDVLVNKVMRDFIVFFHGVLQAMSEGIPARAKPYGMIIRHSSPALFNEGLESLIKGKV